MRIVDRPAAVTAFSPGARGCAPASARRPASSDGFSRFHSGAPTALQPPGAQGLLNAGLRFDGGMRWQPGVHALQQHLIRAGLMTAEQVATGPGYFGPFTRAAVARLQAEAGLGGDGTTFDARTREALLQRLGERASLPADPVSGRPAETPVEEPRSGTPVRDPVPVDGVQGSADDAAIAARIDAMLATTYPTSQLQGQGANFVAFSRKYGVPLGLALAQIGKESTFARHDAGLSLVNHNPGNLRFAEWERAFGAVPGKGGFAAFPSMTHGLEAYFSLLGGDRYGPMVKDRARWSEFIHIYAPPFENDTATYVQQMFDWADHFGGIAGVPANWPIAA